MVRNSDRFANLCNDVIGDISGIISGTASAIVILQLTIAMQQNDNSLFEFGFSVFITSLIVALTVGGKAFGKAFSIRYSSDIIFLVGKTLHFLEEKFHIIIIREKKRNKRNNKI